MTDTYWVVSTGVAKGGLAVFRTSVQVRNPAVLDELLRETCRIRSTTLGELATASGCSRSYLSLLASGRRPACHLDIAHALASELKVDPELIFLTEVTQRARQTAALSEPA